jgi:hypothetical protein
LQEWRKASAIYLSAWGPLVQVNEQDRAQAVPESKKAGQQARFKGIK